MTDSRIQFADAVRDESAGPCRVLMLPTAVNDFVSFRGSFVTHPDFAAGHDVLQDLTVSMLDQGTEARDRFEVAQVLEECGASLNFSSDGLYVDVSGRCLTKDFPTVVEVMAEMLRTPRFAPEPFETTLAKTAGELQRDMEQTRQVAATALMQRLFPADHPNFSETPEAQLQQLQTLTPEDLRAYHDAHFGSNEFTLAVVGDLDEGALTNAVADAFEGWAPHEAPTSYATDADPKPAGNETLPMPGKSNVDVRIGHELRVRRDDDAYLPLYLGNYILGGNFSARLMTQVREERGLTYSISSGLGGISVHYDGYWHTGVALSHDKYDEGMAATMDTIRTFVEEGATQDELETFKETITGSYVVGLSTTKRLARSLLTNAERGFGPAYMDRFPELINAVTLYDVNDAVRQHLRPDALHVCAAGTRPETTPA